MLYVVFQKPTSLLERAMTFNGTHCHCEAVVVENGRHVTFRALAGSPVEKAKVVTGMGDKNYWDWIKISNDEANSMRAASFMNKEVGKPYNYGGYLSCPLGVSMGKIPSNSWFCSELTVAMLQKIDITGETGSLDPRITSPSRLFGALLNDNFSVVNAPFGRGALTSGF